MSQHQHAMDLSAPSDSGGASTTANDGSGRSQPQEDILCIVRYGDGTYDIGPLPSSSPTTPLPGGYRRGERLYYIGPTLLETNNCIMHGQSGNVLDAVMEDDFRHMRIDYMEDWLWIKFPNNVSVTACELDELSRSPPPPPGGYTVNSSPASTVQSLQTRLVEDIANIKTALNAIKRQLKPLSAGPPLADPLPEGLVPVSVRSNLGRLAVPAAAAESDASPPSLPGGYALGEKLFYLGVSQTFDDCGRVVHGEQGEVIGPGEWEGELVIKIRSLNDNFICSLDELSRCPPPPLPGGYTLGEMVYFLGASQRFYDGSGDRLVHGEQGEVVGPGEEGKFILGAWRRESLSIRFKFNKEHIFILLDDLSRSPPPPLPAGYAVGEKLYYVGERAILFNNSVVYGEQGEVILGSYDGELLMKFPNGGVSCRVDELSRSPPPTLDGLQQELLNLVADSLAADLDDVVRAKELAAAEHAHAGRRSGEQDVTRVETHERGDVSEAVRHVVDEVGDTGILAQLTVDATLHADVER